MIRCDTEEHYRLRLSFRHEFHPGVRGARGLPELLPLSVEAAGQPVAQGASHSEHRRHCSLGAHCLHSLQKEGVLEDLTAPAEVCCWQTLMGLGGVSKQPLSKGLINYKTLRMCLSRLLGKVMVHSG